MVTYKCDRCTKFYKPYEPNEITKMSNMLIFAQDRGNKYLTWRRYRLCEDCMKDACRFMCEKLS